MNVSLFSHVRKKLLKTLGRLSFLVLHRNACTGEYFLPISIVEAGNPCHIFLTNALSLLCSLSKLRHNGDLSSQLCGQI